MSLLPGVISFVPQRLDASAGVVSRYVNSKLSANFFRMNTFYSTREIRVRSVVAMREGDNLVGSLFCIKVSQGRRRACLTHWTSRQSLKMQVVTE